MRNIGSNPDMLSMLHRIKATWHVELMEIGRPLQGWQIAIFCVCVTMIVAGIIASRGATSVTVAVTGALTFVGMCAWYLALATQALA